MLEQWFAKATLIDWLLFIAVVGSQVGRLSGWWYRERAAIKAAADCVTKDDLRLFELKYDAEIRQWVRGQHSAYVLHRAWAERNEAVNERIRRLEDK